MDHLLNNLAIFSYLFATIILVLRFVRQFNGHLIAKPLYLVFAIPALIMHALALYHSLFTEYGTDLGFYNAVSLISVLVAALLTLMAMTRQVESMLIIIYPISMLALLLQYNLHQTQLTTPSMSLGMQLHILLSILAYSLLAIAALQSLLLYLQEYMLRKKYITRLLNILPAMQTMEGLLVQLLLVGFFLLSLSLASGLMFLHDIFAQHLAHKTIFSLFAWCIYAVLLWGRWYAGWRGTTITKWALGGFVLLLLAYFGSKFVLELILYRG